MTQSFVDALQDKANLTLTTNGAVALSSTKSELVDLFASIGAMRCWEDSQIETAFIKAFNEDQLLATKMAFYARDIRLGGLGERDAFRIAIHHLANVHPEIIKKNLVNIPLFGRWDDLYELVGTPVENDMWDLIKWQWNDDLDGMKEGRSISVMAKWLKSVKTTSSESNLLGRLTAKQLGYREKGYRSVLAKMRTYLDVVEVKMAGNDWLSINYPGVPSRAMAIYRKAYGKHDPNGFGEYIENLKNGTTKINASTLFPYDILEGMCDDHYFRLYPNQYDEILEQQWKALPNYVKGENNILIMADTSSSMNGRPMATSVGLAIYFAERNHGLFKDVFMTFSRKPSFVLLKGSTLYEKIRSVPAIVENTDLKKAFELILDTAVRNKLSVDDMPRSLVVITDMQFDSHQNDSRNWTFFEEMEQMFKDAGYEIPNVVFWNVNAPTNTFQATCDKKGVQMASGHNPSVFKDVVRNIGKNSYEAMIDALSNPVYDCVVV